MVSGDSGLTVELLPTTGSKGTGLSGAVVGKISYGLYRLGREPAFVKNLLISRYYDVDWTDVRSRRGLDLMGLKRGGFNPYYNIKVPCVLGKEGSNLWFEFYNVLFLYRK